MGEINVEKIADSVVVTLEDGTTLMMATEDAVKLGTALLQVGMLGGDALDEPIEESTGEDDS